MTDKERLQEIKSYFKKIVDEKRNVNPHLNADDIAFLIQQAEQVKSLEKRNMQLNRALKHIAQFPTWFSHERHSKRALKISRRILAKHKSEGWK